MSVRVSFAWYDLWVGAYIDRKNRVLYVCPLPCVLITVTVPALSTDASNGHVSERAGTAGTQPWPGGISNLDGKPIVARTVCSCGKLFPEDGGAEGVCECCSGCAGGAS